MKKTNGMKKFILLASAAAAISFTACNGGAGSASDNELDSHLSQDEPEETSERHANYRLKSYISQEKVDSLVIAMAEVNGMQDCQKFEQALFQDSTLSKEKFLKGVKLTFEADTSLSFLYGMYDGMNFIGQLKQLESIGVNVDRGAFISHFKKYFTADSLNELQAGEARQIANRLQNELREAYMAYERAKNNAHESPTNAKRNRENDNKHAKTDKATKLHAFPKGLQLED